MTRSRWPAVATWAAILGTGLVALVGRFDWSGAERQYARRGYLLSAYMFLLALPLLYFLVRKLTTRAWIAQVATAIGFVTLTLPYRWLGLDRFYYYRGVDRQWYTFSGQIPLPRTRFLPDGPSSTFPNDIALFSILALLALGTAALIWHRGAGSTASGRLRLIALLALFLLILLQTFLHAGVRGPYVYMTHFQEVERENFWYAVSMFEDGSGIVIADQFVFSAIEDYFQGAPREPNNMLIRRPAGFYVAAQFSYFVNSYYVWIVANVLTWFAAVLAGYGFVRRLADDRTAALVAAMIACGTGFVAFVGTPGMYLQASAVVIFALYLLERLLVDDTNWRSYVLFGAALGACSLVYDLVALYPVLLVYGAVRRVPIRPLVGSLAGAYLIYRGFLVVHDVVLDIPVNKDNEAQAGTARRAVLDLVRRPALGDLYGHATDVTATFLVHLTRMFFVLPLLPAIVGIRFLRTKAQGVLVTALAVMSFATIAALRIGDLEIGRVPRFVYPMYPAVYLLTALTLVRVSEYRTSQRFQGALRIAPWLFVVTMLFLANVDAFGFPDLYYEALEGHKPAFTP